MRFVSFFALSALACGASNPTVGEVFTEELDHACARLYACNGSDVTSCKQTATATQSATAASTKESTCTSSQVAQCDDAIDTEDCGTLESGGYPAVCQCP